MIIREFGNPHASVVLIQGMDERDFSAVEDEIRKIQDLSDTDFCLAAVRVDSWNDDLSPWSAPAAFGNRVFGEGARDTLKGVLERYPDDGRKYCIGGYSLAGLFALWAAYQTDRFAGVAAASPSVWFPGFSEYMKEHVIKSGTVYLSLGDREERTGNPMLASVGDCIRDGYETLKKCGIRCILEWNRGNHFMNADLRTARAFAWVMREL